MMTLFAMIQLIRPGSYENMMLLLSEPDSKICYMIKVDKGQMIELYGQLVSYELDHRPDDEIITISIVDGSEYKISKKLAQATYNAVNQWFGDAINEHQIWNEDPTTFELSEEQSDSLDKIIAEHAAKEDELLG